MHTFTLHKLAMKLKQTDCYNVWRIRGKVIRTVLCCVVYESCAQWYAHTYEQILQERWFRFSFMHLFSILYFFRFSLDYFVLVMCAFVVLGLVSSALCQEIGWEECHQK